MFTDLCSEGFIIPILKSDIIKECCFYYNYCKIKKKYPNEQYSWGRCFGYLA